MYQVQKKEMGEIDSQFDGNLHQAPPDLSPGALFHVLSFSLVNINPTPNQNIFYAPFKVSIVKRKASWSFADLQPLPNL